MATTAIRAEQSVVPEHADTPRYARPVLILTAALAALLFTWDIGGASYHPFYADAVRSMTDSWKAFVYGSFDPGNTITLDKLPGFLWPQALAARLLGFHAWALALPQALEGVAAVFVLYRAVRRWAGVDAALLAAVLFTLTPVVTGLFRTSVEDPAFTLLLLLAAEAVGRAAATGRTRTLLLAAVWVGVAFQAKMLEAFAVLPVFALVYLVSAPVGLRRRLWQTLAAGGAAVAVSASWMLLVMLTPAGDRPFVDGTTDNSPLSMVVGYNFLNRFSSVGLNAGGTGSVSAVRNGGGPGMMAHHASDGWGKMLAGPLASQVGWLYPLAAVALLLGLYATRRAPRTDQRRAGYLLWGCWLGTYLLVFSAGSVAGHTYYMGVVAVPLAALSGAGLVALWQGWRAGHGVSAWALPATLALTAAWGAVVARDYPAYLPWLAPAVLALALAAVALLAVPLLRGRRARFGPAARAGLALGLATVLLAPAAWTAAVFNPAFGHGGMGAIGPASRMPSFGRTPHGGGAARTLALGSGGGSAASAAAGAAGMAGMAALWGGHGSQTLTTDQQRLLAYTTAHRGRAAYLFATTTWSTASPYILDANAHVLPMGGFTGQAPFPTLPALRTDVRSGRLRYVLVSSHEGLFGGPPSSDSVPTLAANWVTGSCTAVPATSYGATASPGQTLYDCGGR